MNGKDLLTDEQLNKVQKTLKEKNVQHKVYHKFIGIGIGEDGIPEVKNANNIKGVAELNYYLLLLAEISRVDLIKELIDLQVKKSFANILNLIEKKKEDKGEK